MKHKKIYVNQLQEGEKLEDLFALGSARKAQAKNGPYWQLSLLDCSGEIKGRIWSPLSREYPTLPEETIVRIKASVQSFGQELQLNVERLEVVDCEEVDMREFLPSSEIPPRELYSHLWDILHTNLQFKPWRNLYRRIFKDEEIKEAMINAPGGKSVHHAYLGGLLEHTLSVCRVCLGCSEIYPDLDKDILLLAAAVHDVGKAFEISPGISREYTDEGRLLGHIVIGLQVLDPFLNRSKDLDPELVLHFKHIIASHHGEFEFGSPKRPKTKEAFVLHYADNMDAKINTIESTFGGEDPEGGKRWSNFNRPLGRFLFRPTSSPEPEKKQTKRKKDSPCLLPLKE